MEEADFPVPLEERIGELVAQLELDDPELAALVGSPRRQLAFRTFAYVRAGLLLGELLVDHDLEPEGERSWVDQLLAEPGHYAAFVAEVKAVAREVAADPELADDEVGPDPDALERFRRFVRVSGPAKPV